MGVEISITVYPEKNTFIPNIEELFMFIELLRKKNIIEEKKVTKYFLSKGRFKEKETNETQASYYGSYSFEKDTQWFYLEVILSQRFIGRLVKVLENVQGHSKLAFDENGDLILGKALTIEVCNEPILVGDGDGEDSGDFDSKFLLEWGGKWLARYNLEDRVRDKIMNLFEQEIAPLFNIAFKLKGKIGFAISA
jgi:hypothetical protein